jgi:CRISPR-associated protein Csx16
VTVWFVSRHDSAKAFGRENGYAGARFVDHLDPAEVRPGDTVVGNLPVNLVAIVTARGGRYLHLAVKPPPERRGEELSLEELRQYGARFVEYRVRTPRRWRAALARFIGAVRIGAIGAIDRTVRRWRWKLAERPWRLVTVIGALVLIGFIAANTVSGIVIDALGIGAGSASFGIARILLLLGFALLYGIVVYLLSRFVSAIVWSRMRPVEGADSRCAALIMLMSPLGRYHTVDNAKEALARFRPATDRPPDTAAYAAPTDQYNALETTPDGQDCTKEDLKCLAVPWQQNVRAVHHHGAGLRHVFVLCSKEGNDQWEDFGPFMEAFFPALRFRRVSIEGSEAPFCRRGAQPEDASYEDYDFIREGLNRGVDQILTAAAEAGELLTEADICIDITPGQKPGAIGAAIVTLNRELKLSYVSMRGTVTVFDAEIGTADSLARAIAP